MRDYVFLLFVLGLVPFILYRAWIGALAWTWIGLMNPHLYTWDLRSFAFAQVIGIAFLVGWLVARDKKTIPWTPGVVFMCVLLLYITLKNPFAWNQDVAWTYWSQYVKVVGGALVVSSMIHSPTRVRCFLWVVLISIGVFYGVRGGLFAIGSGGAHNVQGPTPSFIGGNTHLGVAMLMVVPLFVAFVRDSNSKWWRLGATAAIWLTFLAILFTYSRGAWLGLVVVGGLLFLQSKRKLLLMAVLVPIAMVGVALIPEKVFDRADTITEYKDDASAMQRLQGWGVAVNVATRHPLGSGFVLDATPVNVWMSYANFHDERFKRANAAHSIYFQMLGDHGFGGLFLFLLVVAGTFWTLARVRAMTRWDPDRAWLGHYATALMIGLAGYCVSGAFVSLAYFDLFYTFVILSGILMREARPVTEDRPAEDSSDLSHPAVASTGSASTIS